MPTEPLFLLAVGVAILAVLAALAGLWWYSGEPEQHHGPWERPAAAAPQSPLPPGYQLVLDLAGSDWTDTEGWKQLVARLNALANRLDAGAAPIPAPPNPDSGWFDAELSRLEGIAGPVPDDHTGGSSDHAPGSEASPDAAPRAVGRRTAATTNRPAPTRLPPPLPEGFRR